MPRIDRAITSGAIWGVTVLCSPILAHAQTNCAIVSDIPEFVSVANLGIHPVTPGNDYRQAWQPTLMASLQNAAKISEAIRTHDVVAFTEPGTYYIGGKIKIMGSNKTLMATCPGVVVKMQEGMSDYMLTIGAQSLFTPAGRNLRDPAFNDYTVSNVLVKGIEFQRSGQYGSSGPGPGYNGGWPGHTCWVTNFRNVRFEDCSFTTYDRAGRIIGGKYAVLMNNGRGFSANNIHFNNHSDGFHPQGPIEDVTLTNLWGFTGDNMVGITQGDYTQYETTYGNMRRITVDGVTLDIARMPDGVPTLWWDGHNFVYPDGSIQPVRTDGHDGYWTNGQYASARPPYEISDLTVRNITGPLHSGQSAIALIDGGFGNGPVRVRRVLAEGLGISGGGWAGAIQLSSRGLGDVTLRDIDVRSPYAFACVLVTYNVIGSEISIDASNLTNYSAASQSSILKIEGPVHALNVRNSTLVGTGSPVRFIDAGRPGATIVNLTGSNLLMDMSSGGGSTSRFIHTADGDSRSYVGNGVLDNVRLISVGFLVDAANNAQSSPRSQLFVSNLTELGSSNEHVTGRADVKIAGVYRNFKGQWRNSTYRTGSPTVTVLPQWNRVVLNASEFTQGPTASLDVNSLGRYADVLGLGFLPRGTTVHALRITPVQQFAGAGVTTAVLSVGTLSDPYRLAPACMDLTTVNPSALELAPPGTNGVLDPNDDQDVSALIELDEGTSLANGQIELWLRWSCSQN